MQKYMLFLLLAILCLSEAFRGKLPVNYRFRNTPFMAVTEVSSIAALDAAVTAAGSSLLVIDYSTTWCGPCKIALPKFIGSNIFLVNNANICIFHTYKRHTFIQNCLKDMTLLSF